jgi:16S rRNA G527 N7-methylase RsmG
METVVRELEFVQTEVINVRAEDIPAIREGQFDAVIFRAVSSLNHCLLLGERFVAPGGRLIVKKPPEESPTRQEFNLSLKDDISITSYQGLVSRLLVYEKCFT